jgi:methionyl-tRNA formyltransferase
VRVLFLGNDPWSVPTLEALAEADDVWVELVITNLPRPAGRGSRLTSTAVADAARALGLELLEVDGVRAGDGWAALESSRPDAIVVVAYGELLPPAVLELPALGTINLHFSLLPRWRGAAPVQRAILEGDETTGVSVMLLDEGLDTGPILIARQEPILPGEDAGSLGARLAEVGAPLVVDALRALIEGTAAPVPQGDAGVTFAVKPQPEERRIDWRDPAEEIVRRVRAFAPAPGATTTFRATPLKLLRTEVRAQGASSEADRHGGEVWLDGDGTPVVMASEGGVAALEVAPAGRSRMLGADWARGARIQPGERCT